MEKPLQGDLTWKFRVISPVSGLKVEGLLPKDSAAVVAGTEGMKREYLSDIKTNKQSNVSPRASDLIYLCPLCAVLRSDTLALNKEFHC